MMDASNASITNAFSDKIVSNNWHIILKYVLLLNSRIVLLLKHFFLLLHLSYYSSKLETFCFLRYIFLSHNIMTSWSTHSHIMLRINKFISCLKVFVIVIVNITLKYYKILANNINNSFILYTYIFIFIYIIYMYIYLLLLWWCFCTNTVLNNFCEQISFTKQTFERCLIQF